MVARQTQQTVNRTRTKHGRQTDTTLHDTLSTRPAQSMVARQTQLHDTLLTRPAQSMVARQTQHYMTHYRQYQHEAWSPDRHNIT